jgi:mRNA surveillance protein pelota
MKLLDRNKGVAKVVVETADDLWFLHTIIDKGDLCTGDSEYKYKIGDGREGKTQVAKKRVWVRISVEKTEFDRGQFRITGKVVDGSEEVPRGSYHSLDIFEGVRLELAKERWLDYQEEKLQEALNSAKLSTLLVLFDREQAIFAILKPNGHEVLLTLKGDVPKKGVDESKIHSFYKDIAKHMGELCERHHAESIIAASPSFWKEYLEKEVGDLRSKTIFTAVSAVDETAINEILRRPELQQALRAERATRELHMIEKVLQALAKDMLIYGKEDLQAAIAEGNLSEIFVSESAIFKAKEEDRFDGLEQLMKSASDVKAKVHLFSTHDATAKIDGFGGIVGIKRW